MKKQLAEDGVRSASDSGAAQPVQYISVWRNVNGGWQIDAWVMATASSNDAQRQAPAGCDAAARNGLRVLRAPEPHSALQSEFVGSGPSST